MDTNVLYWGDNLHIPRNKDYFPDQSLDLIYLDPPFNSNASYNVLFKEATGEQSTAQLQAFTDTGTGIKPLRIPVDRVRGK